MITLISLCFFVVRVCTNELLLDYYEDLIRAQIERAATYRFAKDASEFRPYNAVPKEYGTYDFVVIGGGSAGSIVASRLSEIKKWRVLLLEAGKEENDFTDIPAMTKYLSSLEYNWGFNSTPQDNCCRAQEGNCPYPRGKSLGGSSAINSLAYVRGNKLDFDKWASLGNPGWSYEDVLPYFIKSENSHVKGDAGYHGHNGYLNVEYHIPMNRKMFTFFNAGKELNRSITDVNGKQQLGVSYNNFNTNKGKRHSASRAFLTPTVRRRKNLRILTESYVTKIVIDEHTKKANSVLFSHKNTLYVVSVNMEVILSAGVVGSPTILMHSGVGPKEHLSKYNIATIEDLEVGLNMHDHLTFHNFYLSTTKYDLTYSLRTSIKKYLEGTGPFTITTNPQGISFAQIFPNSSLAPHFEFIFVPYVDVQDFSCSDSGIIYGLMDRTTKRFLKRSIRPITNIAQLVVVLLHPKTRGSVYLNSSDPYIYPLIDSKCLCDDKNEDVEHLYAGILKLMEIVDTISFQEISADVVVDPRCSLHVFNSKDYWLCSIKETATNAYHGGGTCQMGPDPAKGAVVNCRLQVYGVRNLRVADASVVPVTLSGHMNAPAMMVGERVVDFIKVDYNTI
ncbi:hypothetical protein FQA39_LY17734 [Lamprigera yunnana]|nr:hypothetical protein FQA39_LY17734 [Lamprigera yunnana]